MRPVPEHLGVSVSEVFPPPFGDVGDTDLVGMIEYDKYIKGDYEIEITSLTFSISKDP